MKEKAKIKAVLINPKDKTVTDIEIVPDFKHYYEIMDTDIIQSIHPIPGYTLWLDEEGALKPNSHFVFNNNPGQILSGKAVFVKGIVGTNSAYNATHIRKLITFI